MCYYVNNMKRIIPAILLLLALTGCYNSGEPRERVLKIYNWADYIGEGVLEDFQAYYKEQTGENIRIVYQTFDINEIMLTKIEKGHEDFDVVCPSEPHTAIPPAQWADPRTSTWHSVHRRSLHQQAPRDDRRTMRQCSYYLRDSRPCEMLRLTPSQWTELRSAFQR